MDASDDDSSSESSETDEEQSRKRKKSGDASSDDSEDEVKQQTPKKAKQVCNLPSRCCVNLWSLIVVNSACHLRCYNHHFFFTFLYK